MQSQPSSWLPCLVAAGLLVCMPGLVKAQQGATEAQQVQRRANRPGANLGRLDDQTRGSMVRASELIGMNIQNDQDESVGEIHDLVIDSQSGRVRYAAVTYGGFLGLGDKLFAVPFQAFQAQQDPEDSDEIVLILNVTQQQLEGAQGFDEEDWPNFGNRTFTREIDRRYGVQRNRMQRQDSPRQGTQRQGLQRQGNLGGNVDGNRDGSGIDADVDGVNE